jgi:hypothetical protein
MKKLIALLAAATLAGGAFGMAAGPPSAMAFRGARCCAWATLRA